ncbi:MAG: hypothetical protein COA65_06805 [Rhodospirillaceae bacterium]|nr:MAG: hypothetical protein COA65_06805 [Rhodospirillaceae bacterium]
MSSAPAYSKMAVHAGKGGVFSIFSSGCQRFSGITVVSERALRSALTVFMIVFERKDGFPWAELVRI